MQRMTRRLFDTAFFAVTVLLLATAANAADPGCHSGPDDDHYSLSNGNCAANASSGSSATAIGSGSNAVGTWAMAVGDLATANHDFATAIGTGAGYDGAGRWSTALGAQATGAGQSAIAIGGLAQASALFSIAIGTGNYPNDAEPAAIATGNYGIAIGSSATVAGLNVVAVGAFAGFNPGANNDYSSAFGAGAGRDSKGQGYVALGLASGQQVVGDLNTAIGNSAGQIVTGTRNVSTGVSAGQNIKGSYNIALGDQAGSITRGNNNIAIGASAGRNVRASNTISIGHLAHATANTAVAIGAGSIASIANTVSIGTAGSERRLMNLADATAPTDAVNLRQVQNLIQAIYANTRGTEFPGVELPRPATLRHTVSQSSMGPVAIRADDTQTADPDNEGCHPGDLAGTWSLSGNALDEDGAQSMLWCDMAISAAGNGYNVAGECRRHSMSGGPAEALSIEGRQSISLDNSCRIGGSFAVKQRGVAAAVATVLEGRLESVGATKSRALLMSRWPNNGKMALQSFVLQR